MPKKKLCSYAIPKYTNTTIDEFGISFAHASVRGHSTKQAFSAVEFAREEYFFCGPSPGILCLFRVYPKWPLKYPMVLCSLRDTKLAYSPNELGIFITTQFVCYKWRSIFCNTSVKVLPEVSMSICTLIWCNNDQNYRRSGSIDQVWHSICLHRWDVEIWGCISLASASSLLVWCMQASHLDISTTVTKVEISWDILFVCACRFQLLA